MAYVPAKDECGTLTVDKLPVRVQSGDPITRITSDSVVMRTDAGIWIAENRTPDVLDAEVVE